jgi:hypothetical protein
MEKELHIALTVAGIAVVLVLFGTYLNDTGNRAPSTDDFIGEWDIVEAQKAYYDDGVPTIEQLVLDAEVSIEKMKEGYYALSLFGDHAVCVANADMLFSTNIDGCDSLTIHGMRDSLTITLLYPDSGIALSLQRSGTERIQPEGQDIPPAVSTCDPPMALEDGTVLKAFRAVEFTGIDVIDHMDRGYELTILKNEYPFVFYNVTCSEFSWNYIAMPMMKTNMLATTYLNEDMYVQDMVHFADGIVYTSSFDNAEGRDVAVWSVAYGDESKEQDWDSFAISDYEGTETSYVWDQEQYEYNSEIDVDMSIIYQYENLLIVKTETAEGTISYWGGLIFKEDKDYCAVFQSVTSYYGLDMYGTYICNMSYDISGPVTVIGALLNSDGLAAAFHQSLTFIS